MGPEQGKVCPGQAPGADFVALATQEDGLDGLIHFLEPLLGRVVIVHALSLR